MGLTTFSLEEAHMAWLSSGGIAVAGGAEHDLSLGRCGCGEIVELLVSS